MENVLEINSREILNSWNEYIIEKLIPLVGETPEGNLYSKNNSILKTEDTIPKQINIINLINKIQPKTILEIGFNTGFSTLLMKMVKPDVKITCIDINTHFYILPCYNQISKDFDEIELITENSQIALPKIKKKFDIIHIDGNHSISGATKDLELCLKLSKKGTVIIFDDTNMDHLNGLCDKYVRNKKVKEYIGIEKIDGIYQHRFLEVK